MLARRAESGNGGRGGGRRVSDPTDGGAHQISHGDDPEQERLHSAGSGGLDSRIRSRPPLREQVVAVERGEARPCKIEVAAVERDVQMLARLRRPGP